MSRKNEKKLTVILLTVIFVFFYLTGWYFIGGKKYSITPDDSMKSILIELYDINGLDKKDIISFKHISYMRRYANVLVLNRNNKTETVIKENSHIQKIKKLNVVSLPYPNKKYIPYRVKECCCFYDSKYYYISAYGFGSKYNRTINDYFWKIKESET